MLDIFFGFFIFISLLFDICNVGTKSAKEAEAIEFWS